MAVADDIIAERIYGVVHCGLSSTARSLPELAREFALADDEANYRQIDAIAAKQVIESILHKDLAYRMEIMSAFRAAELANRFLAAFGSDGVQYYTNQEPMGWNPVTSATFDTGVLVLGPRISGCIWVEDED